MKQAYRTAPGLVSQGFTLIELMVVVSIIALLSSIILVAIGSAQSKTRDGIRIQNMTAMRTALQLYASNHVDTLPHGDFFSGSINTGGVDDWLPKTETSPPSLAYLLSPYLSTLPLDPSYASSCSIWVGPVCQARYTAKYIYYYYTDSFQSGELISSTITDDPVAAGSCYHKALIMLNNTETRANPKQECQFQDDTANNILLKSQFPNAFIMLLN